VLTSKTQAPETKIVASPEPSGGGCGIRGQPGKLYSAFAFYYLLCIHVLPLLYLQLTFLAFCIMPF